MANLLYLLGAIVVSVVGVIILVVRNRKPTSIEAGIEAFNRELRALAPDQRPGGSRAQTSDRHRGPGAG